MQQEVEELEQSCSTNNKGVSTIDDACEYSHFYQLTTYTWLSFSSL